MRNVGLRGAGGLAAEVAGGFAWVLLLCLVAILAASYFDAAIIGPQDRALVSDDAGRTWRPVTVREREADAARELRDGWPMTVLLVVPAAAIAVLFNGFMTRRRKWNLGNYILTCWVCCLLVWGPLFVGFIPSSPGGAAVALGGAWTVWNLPGARYRLVELPAAVVLGFLSTVMLKAVYA